MRADTKEELSIDLIRKNEVYGDTRHEGKFVLFYLYLIFTGIWGVKPRDHCVASEHVELCKHRNEGKGHGDGNTFIP